jgi:hypothetical protein
MNAEILHKLSESDITVPALASGLAELKASVEALETALQQARIASVLIAAREELVRIGVAKEEIWFAKEDALFGRVENLKPFDPCFYVGVNLCLAVNSEVRIALGGSYGCYKSDGEPFWLGYLKQTEGKSDARTKTVALGEAQRRREGNSLGTNEPWLAWWWFQKVDLGKACEEHLVESIASYLVEMRDTLRERLE